MVDEMCDLLCELPLAPTLTILHGGALLVFESTSNWLIQTGISSEVDATEPEIWHDTDRVEMPTADLPRSVKVFARLDQAPCAGSDQFSFVYEVRDSYPPAAGEEGSTAISMDDSSIVGWADGWIDPVQYGEGVTDTWRTPARALGPADGTSVDVVSLGEGGRIVMTFSTPIADGDGWDLVVFENSFNAAFLELAWIEVSSDGETFLRFDNLSLIDGAVAGYGTLDPTEVGSLAGTYAQGWGAPFDLAALANHLEVRDGTVDLQEISYVRVVDVLGDGSSLDSLGDVIWDPYPTLESAGFDLDAIGVLHLGR